MKSRTIAIAGSIAALTFAAGPVTAYATAKSHHRPATQSQLDRSRDVRGVRHVDKSPDKSTDRVDNSRDLRDL
jgi:Ni/Co efflux regulator RcnB